MAASYLAEAIPWFGDPEGVASASAARILTDLLVDHPDVGNSVAELSWVIDDVTKVEVDLLQSLRGIANSDAELARELVNRPWLADGVTSYELDGIRVLEKVGSRDSEVARNLATFPWVFDGLDEFERSAVDRLSGFIGSEDDLDRRLAELVVNSGWFTSGVSKNEAWTMGVLSSVVSEYRQVLPAFVEFKWAFDDDLTGPEYRTVTNVRDLELFSPGSGVMVIEFAWLIDGITDEESSALGAIRHLAEFSPGLDVEIIGQPWVADGITASEAAAINAFKYDPQVDLDRPLVETVTLAEGFTHGIREDNEFARQIAALPWFANGLDGFERSAVDRLSSFIGSKDDLDRRLAEQVVNSGWFTSGVSKNEAWTMGVLSSVVSEYRQVLPAIIEFKWAFDDDLTGPEYRTVTNVRDLELFNPGSGVMVIEFAWLFDGITDEEGSALGAIRHLAEFSPGLDVEIIGQPWIADGITVSEVAAINALKDYPDAANWLLDQAWVTDGVTYNDARLMHGWGNVFAVADTLDRDPFEFLSLLVDEADGPYSPIEGMLMRSLGRGPEDEEERRMLLEELTSADWFIDGLTDEERVHIIGFSSGRISYREVPNMSTDNVHLWTIDLPEAGAVNLWMLEGSTIPWERAMEWLEDAVRGVERIIGEPFPFSDLVVATVAKFDYDGKARSRPGLSFDGGQRIEIVDNLTNLGMRQTMYHEVAHVYLRSPVVPLWFSESWAEYAREHIQTWKGYSDQDPHIRMINLVQQECTSKGILKITEALVESPGVPPFCKFQIGLHLLLTLEKAVGIEAVQAALGDLHRSAQTSEVPISDRDIFEAFLEHAPLGTEEGVREIWERLFGALDEEDGRLVSDSV